MDLEGYILTGPENRQFNLANDILGTEPHWTGYSAADAPRKPYTCGACHTTGWQATGPEGGDVAATAHEAGWHTLGFEAEDAGTPAERDALLKEQQTRKTIGLSLLGTAGVCFVVDIFI